MKKQLVEAPIPAVRTSKARASAVPKATVFMLQQPSPNKNEDLAGYAEDEDEQVGREKEKNWFVGQVL